METFDVFKHIAERTGGDIYIGILGPVRSGKSTFIRKFVELFVLPNVTDPNVRERIIDALPQAAAGKTIMTVEPKFIPEQGVEITLKDSISLRVRLVDCTGYVVPGSLGVEEDDSPRMVTTPWLETPVTFQEAAEMGTRKVITEHATLGIVVTTDGSITDIPRENYVSAEKQVVQELKELGKPFIVILNSINPMASSTLELAAKLEKEYDVSVVPLDVENLKADDVSLVMEQVLYEFPIKEINIQLPAWVNELEKDHWLRSSLEKAIAVAIGGVRRVRDVEKAIATLGSSELVESTVLEKLEMGTGLARASLKAKESLYYKVVEELLGQPVSDSGVLLKCLRELAKVKSEWDKVEEGLNEVRETGYGMIAPTMSDLQLAEPELIRQGNRFGVRLKASAPSIHLIRADIETEITPIIGTEKQCEELVRYILDQFEDDPKRIWETDIFGKSMSELIREGIQNKLSRMPENAQEKLREAISRVVNEGSAGLICIIL
ncbi:MAG TPA: stage IV sporulation protein A [Firmicutes bacterium]|nr:stage IV sporulation protein A [Bacillota bacterium]